MESQIKIHFEETPKGIMPTLNIRYQESDDSRDALIKSFFTQLGSKSSWLSVSFDHHLVGAGRSTTFITLRAVPEDELFILSDEAGGRASGEVQSEGGPLNLSPFVLSKKEAKDRALKKAFEEKCANRRKRS